MGETRVDLHHLLEDLRDAYTGALEETILAEIVANALDSGADRVGFTTDPTQSTLTVLDNGSGMKRRELARYHDIAASAKARGEGIGFAGVGIKLGLLLCDEVLTETQRGKSHIATRWHLANRHRAPWKWVDPPGRVTARGTAVSLGLANALSPLLDPGFVESMLRRHFQPLLELEFDPILSAHYPKGVVLEVNGRPLKRTPAAGDQVAPLVVRLGRRRKPSAIGYLVREDGVLAEEDRGLAVSTLGKVIKRGWDWLGVNPATPERIGGVMEVPELAACLTLNKGDFVRTGPRGAMFLSYRKAIQESVSAQLAAWGDARDTMEEKRRRAARPVERDLERILVDMADDFPLLGALVERHAGGQRRLPIGGRAAEEPHALLAASVTTRAEREEVIAALAVEDAEGEAEALPTTPSPPLPASAQIADGRGPRRPVRYGLAIQFESRPEDPELGRLVESTVWVNEAHPAYRRAVASRSEGYHLALAVALALAPLAVEARQEHLFVTSFLARWGASLETAGPRRRV